MMKMNAMLLALSLSAAVACAEPKTIEGVTYEPYGLLDEEEVRSPDVVYQVNVGNVIHSVLWMETIAVPVWLVGFQLYEPVALKTYQSY